MFLQKIGTCFSGKQTTFVETLTHLTSLQCFEMERIECARPVNTSVRDSEKLRQKTLVSEGLDDVYLGYAKYRVRKKVVRFQGSFTTSL